MSFDSDVGHSPPADTNQPENCRASAPPLKKTRPARANLPAMVSWPGKIEAGEVSNEIFSGLDWFPTFLAAAGDTTVKDRLLTGWAPSTGGATFRVHLDGYNQLPYLTGQQPKSARTDFAYYDDDGVLVAFRHENWKAIFCEQKKPGGFPVW